MMRAKMRMEVLVIACSIAMLAAMTGCAGKKGEPESSQIQETPSVEVGDRQGGSSSVESDIAGDTAVTTESPIEDADAEDPKVKAMAEALPSIAQLPPERTADEVRIAIARYILGEYPDVKVLSAKILGTGHEASQQSVGVEDYWASYLIEISGHGRIGIMETCSSATEPMVHERDLLVVSTNEFYDVKRETYRTQEVIPEGQEEEILLEKMRAQKNEPGVVYDR